MTRVVTVLVLAAWSFWLAWPYLVHGSAAYIRQHDTAEVNTPWYTAIPLLSSRDLRGFRDPLAGAGVDALSNLKGDMPLVEAFFYLGPHWSSSGLLLVAQTLAAATGMYVLLRRRFDAAAPPALLAAAWFAFLPALNVPYSGMPTWYGFSVAGLPLVLLALDAAARRPHVRTAVAMAVATGAALAWGTPTASGMPILGLVALWLMMLGRGQNGRLALLFTCFGAAFLTVKTPTIAALMATAPDSHRMVRTGLPFGVDSSLDLWRSRLTEVRELVLPHAPALAVATAGWWLTRLPALTRVLAMCAVLVGLTALAPLVQMCLGVLDPVFRSYQVDRFNRYFPFLAAAAAGIALGSFRRNHVRQSVRRIAWTLSWAGLVAVLALLSIRMNVAREAFRREGNRYDALFRHPLLLDLARRHDPAHPFRVATFADRNVGQYGQHAAFAWAYGLETADLYGASYPLRYHAFWARVIEPVREHRPDIRDYFERWGNMAYLFNPAAPLFGPLDPAYERPGPGLPFDLGLLSLANVRYVISRETLVDQKLRLQSAAEGLKLYANDTVLPRFFVVNGWRCLPSGEAVLSAASASEPAALGAIALLEAEDCRRSGLSSTPQTAPLAASVVRVVAHGADLIDLDVETDTGGMLIVTNNFSRHWTARIDGTAADLVPAYHTFQGLPLPAGAHAVRLRYEPPQAVGGRWQPLMLLLALGLLWGMATAAVQR